MIRFSVLPALMVLAGCAPGPDQVADSEKPRCLLEQYKLPELEYASDSNFDAKDNLSGLRVEIPAEVLADEIPGYQGYVTVGSGEQPQFLYLTFSTPYEPIHFYEAQVQPVAEHEDLFRVSGDSQYHWDLAEREGDHLILWGSCSDNFQGSFDCMSHLTHEQVAINYEVQQANLHLYAEIEAFLQSQLKFCNSGT